MTTDPANGWKLWRYWITGLAVVLAGCGSLPRHAPPQADGAPGYAVDVNAIPDAVPRVEPRSPYGNPDVYEVAGRRYKVMADSRGYVERGIASWYGTKFHGRRAAIGEPYDMFAMTAAHKTLPLPTYVEVTNLENGRKVIVRVNDRGPFKANRIIDLSYAAAAKLGIVETGTGIVEIRAIDPVAWQQARRPSVSHRVTAPDNDRPQAPAVSSPAPASGPVATRISTDGSTSDPNSAGSHDAAALRNATLYLQIGAFAKRHNAEALRRRLESLAPGNIRIVHANVPGPPLYRVHIGPLSSVEDADRLSRDLIRLGLGEPHIVVY